MRKLKKVKTNFYSNYLVPLACYIDDSLLPFEKMLLYHFLRELGLKSIMQLTASLFFDRHNIHNYETNEIIREKEKYNSFFADLLSNYYSHHETEDIKFELFLNRLLRIVINFNLKKIDNPVEINQARFIFIEHKLMLVSPHMSYLPENEVKKINNFYDDINSLINEYERKIITKSKQEDLKILILKTIIDASIQLQQKNQILKDYKNAPIENNRTELLMIIIN